MNEQTESTFPPVSPRPAEEPGNEIWITREYDAPLADVWSAWTEPDQLAQWWGPRGSVITTHSHDLRPGGTWRYNHRTADGTDWPNVTLFHEVEPMRRLVYDHGATDETNPLFRVVAEFSETGGKTTLAMRMILSPTLLKSEMLQHIKDAGGNGTWDRLGEYLAGERGQSRFLITRSFDAPIDGVFDAFTNPDQVERWLPPAGVETTFLRRTIAQGESLFFRMSFDGSPSWARFHYDEISRPNRIVYTQQFVDESEQPARHSMMPDFPEKVQVELTLTAESKIRTRVKLQLAPIDASEAETKAFGGMRDGLHVGWTASLDNLESLLATL